MILAVLCVRVCNLNLNIKIQSRIVIKMNKYETCDMKQTFIIFVPGNSTTNVEIYFYFY